MTDTYTIAVWSFNSLIHVSMRLKTSCTSNQYRVVAIMANPSSRRILVGFKMSGYLSCMYNTDTLTVIDYIVLITSLVKSTQYKSLPGYVY